MLVCGYHAHIVLSDLARLQHYLTTYPNNNSICESWKALVDNYSRSLKLDGFKWSLLLQSLLTKSAAMEKRDVELTR